MAYRKIDVDAFDEDRFLEDEDLATVQPSTGDEEGSSAVAKANVTNVQYKAPQSASEVEKTIDSAVAEARSHLNKYFNF
jgi:hypothetical protein